MQVNLNEFYDLPKAQIIRIQFLNDPHPIYGWMATKRSSMTLPNTIYGHLNQVLNIKQLKEGTGYARIKLISVNCEDFEEFKVMNTADIVL
jgi:hypothetical protein